MNEGRLEVEPTPQGTLAEMMRCGGAGLGGFLTPPASARWPRRASRSSSWTAASTSSCRRSSATSPSSAPTRGDTWGNLIYRGTSRNFNVPAAMCADYVIAEVENLYTHRRARPRTPSTPRGIFVDAVVRANIEYCTHPGGEVQWPVTRRQVIAARAGQELKDGQIINLGIGLPTLVANYVPEGVDVVIQTENGAIGVGPAPEPGCEDRDRANAGNQPITLIPGGSYFDSATSFAHDPRRPRRRHLPRHAAGRREGQHRQLDRARQDARRHGRRHGPHHRRQGRLHRQRALLQGRRLQAHEGSAPSRSPAPKRPT